MSGGGEDVVIRRQRLGLTRWNMNKMAAGIGTSSLLNSQRLLNKETPGILDQIITASGSQKWSNYCQGLRNILVIVE